MKESCGCWDGWMKKMQEFLLVLLMLGAFGMSCTGMIFFIVLTMRLIVGF